MHTNLDTAILNRSQLVLPVPRALTAPARPIPGRRAAFEPNAALRRARHEVVRGHASEEMVWIGLALASLGALVLSFAR
jgi:hypothetical protein